MVSNISNDRRASSMLEFALVFPMLMLFVLGTVDVSLLMVDWASYNRATFTGARFAVVSNPVAVGINAAITGTKPGQACVDYTTGTSTVFCTTRLPTACIATSATTGGSCSNGYTFSDSALDAIVQQMNKFRLEGKLDRRQILVSYTPLAIGFVSRPQGYPVTVTIRLRCLYHRFFFLGPLARWIFPAPDPACIGIPIPNNGYAMPSFRTTLPSEDLVTN